MPRLLPRRLPMYTLVLLGCLCGSLARPARAELPPVGVNPGAPIWDGNILLTDELAAQIAASGCRAVRVNFRIDGNATWNPTHLARYDTIIQNARSHDLQVLGLICYEAVAGSQAQWNANYNTTGMNPYIDTFAATAWQLIARYQDDVKYFELWNEPDCWSVPPQSNPLEPGCFYIWPRNYANLLAQTYLECVTQGGSDFFSTSGVALSTGGLFAHDIGGSFTPSMTTYMNNVYAQDDIWDAFEAATGRRYPWDRFGYHFYLNQGEPVSTTELQSYFDTVRFWKNWYSDPADLLVTEFGWNTQAISPQLQAANLRDAYDWLRAQDDVTCSFWYQWNDGDGGWGLVSGPGNPKPSYFEFEAQCDQVSQPTAAFAAEPQTGPAPLTVHFTDLTAGLVDTWLWDFGDGHTSADPNPVHEYTVGGVYSVTLTVTGPGGVDSLTCPNFITVIQRADLDADGDVDVHDLAQLAHCFRGPGQTTVPPGCECINGTAQPAQSTAALAGSLAGLSHAIAAGDLLHGAQGTLEAGGFHAATPGGAAGGLADLTDGVAGSSAEAVLADYSRPALQVRYDFATPQNLGSIHVFAANSDGRVFQNYDVHYSQAGSSAYQPLIADVRAGTLGQVNNGQWGASLTRITPQAPGPIAVNVDALRLTFFDVSTVDPANTFWDEWDASESDDADGAPRAYVASIVKEIDVFTYVGPPLVTNRADQDGDFDVDFADLALFLAQLSGPN